MLLSALLLQAAVANFQVDKYGFLNAAPSHPSKGTASCIASRINPSQPEAAIRQHANVFYVSDGQGAEIAVLISQVTAKTLIHAPGTSGQKFIDRYADDIKECL